MTNDLIFRTNSIFDSVTYDKDSDSWHFYFADKIYVSVAGFWRLLKANKIMFISLDNGHQFGLSKPLNLIDEISKQLIDKKLIEIKVDRETGDLTLLISNDFKIEIFIASYGYETYNFSIQGKRYIGMGSGKIGIVEETNNPHVFTTRQL